MLWTLGRLQKGRRPKMTNRHINTYSDQKPELRGSENNVRDTWFVSLAHGVWLAPQACAKFWDGGDDHTGSAVTSMGYRES